MDVEKFYEFSRANGANRLVITGGGEPLLAPEAVVSLIRRGRPYFSEIACFTNGTYLTADLASQLAEAGLSYICYSRHHYDDEACRRLMGADAPDLGTFVRAATPLKIRATCVMTKGWIDSREEVNKYIRKLEAYGIREFTFKHTYVAYEQSVFANSDANHWSQQHQVEEDPFHDQGTSVARLPWGPIVRRLGDSQVCYYFEPTPNWELENLLCRSTNLLSNGKVYASLENEQSQLFQLKS